MDNQQRASVLNALKNRQQIQALKQKVEERKIEEQKVEEEMLRSDPISNPSDEANL